MGIVSTRIRWRVDEQDKYRRDVGTRRRGDGVDSTLCESEVTATVERAQGGRNG